MREAELTGRRAFERLDDLGNKRETCWLQSLVSEGSLDDLSLRRGTYIEQDGDGMSAADGVLRPLQVALEVPWIERFDQIHALQHTYKEEVELNGGQRETSTISTTMRKEIQLHFVVSSISFHPFE